MLCVLPNWSKVGSAFIKYTTERAMRNKSKALGNRCLLCSEQGSLEQTHTNRVTWEISPALRQPLLPCKQTFDRTVTEHHRLRANTFQFHQAPVLGDNCLLWHDLCNTFHPVILESKEFYQKSSHSDRWEWFLHQPHLLLVEPTCAAFQNRILCFKIWE